MGGKDKLDEDVFFRLVLKGNELSGSSSWQLWHTAQLSSALRHHHIIDWHTDWQWERSGSGGRKSMWMQWRTEISRLPEVHYWVKYGMHVSVCVCVRGRNIKAFSSGALLMYMSFLHHVPFFIDCDFLCTAISVFPETITRRSALPTILIVLQSLKGTLNRTSPVPLFKCDQLEMSHWKGAAVRQWNCEKRKEWRCRKEKTDGKSFFLWA